MGVLYPEERGEWWAPQDLRCFVCGERPLGPLVYWSGAESSLVLCPADAAYLGAHLLGDAREATLATGGHPWGARATRAAVAAIERMR